MDLISGGTLKHYWVKKRYYWVQKDQDEIHFMLGSSPVKHEISYCKISFKYHNEMLTLILAASMLANMYLQRFSKRCNEKIKTNR